MPHLWDSDEGICREWEHDDASCLAAEAFAAGQAVGFTCYGTDVPLWFASCGSGSCAAGKDRNARFFAKDFAGKVERL